jgi:hypothetical protein
MNAFKVFGNERGTTEGGDGRSSSMKIARLAGLFYLIFILTFVLATYIRSQIIVFGDSATTASNITSNELLFRFAFVSEIISALFFVLAAWALYVLLRPVNKDLALRDNYFAGGTTIRWWEKVVGSGNTFIARGGAFSLDCAKCGDPAQYDWDKNTYISGEKTPLSLTTKEGGKALSFEEWKKATGLDKESRCTVGAPTGLRVFVRPSQYEPGRANVIVYNWDKKDSVEVDLKDVLKSGAKYRVMNAQDFFGKPVAEGTFDGKPVALPMKEYRAPAPVGKPDYVAPATGPEFNVFVVLPV